MIQHTDASGGRRLWLEPEVEAFIHVLENGHPTLGWEGDPQLALFRIEGNRWEIARLENGRYNTVCRSKPNAKLDLGVIIRLIEADSHRKTHLQMLEEINKHNAVIQKDLDDHFHGRTAEALEKVYWGVGKDLGERRQVTAIP